MLNNYKERNKYNNNTNITIKDVLNFKNIAIGKINSFYYKNNIKLNFEEEIMNFKISDNTVVKKLEVSFERKNKQNVKNIFSIMIKEMEHNLKTLSNIQYFSDVTYYCIPPNIHKFRLFILLSFNKEKYKTLLCNISLISNEYIETFQTILEFLKKI